MTHYLECRKKIYFNDTDSTQIVYYSRHLEWMEMVRIEYITQVYKPLTRIIAEDQVSFTPINVNITYKNPVRFEDTVIIKAGVKTVEKLKLIMDYQILKESANQLDLVAQAEITLVCIDTAKNNRPTRIPASIAEAINNWNRNPK